MTDMTADEARILSAQTGLRATAIWRWAKATGFRSLWEFRREGEEFEETRARMIEAVEDWTLNPPEKFPTELTPEGEQYVVPGCERKGPKTPEQGSLW